MSNAKAVPVPAPVYDLSKAQSASKDVVAKEAGHWPRVFTTDAHPFDLVEWKVVDAEIRDPNGEIVFEQKGVEVPAWWSQNTINVVAEKYLRVAGGVKESSVKQIFTRVASVIRAWAEEQHFFNTEKDAIIYEAELLHCLVHQYGAFNSPVWFNLGIKGRAQAASACFISSVDDSLDDIINYQKSELTIFRSGSGSGANLSNLRSSYEKLSAGSYTSGPLSFMKGNDQFAGAMKSGGATRNAAKMVVMDMDHPDVLETRDRRPGFIRCKATAEKLAHDLVAAGYSAAYDDPNGAYKLVPYQNANHSVSIPDSFMQAVIDDGVWQTKERVTGKVVHTYKARDLWAEIARAAWTCGDPGVQYNDVMNKWHTTPKSGRIRASNPCSEFIHVDNTACNLCAINLTKFFDDRKFSYDRFHQAVRVFSTAQMAIVAKADYPTKEIAENSHRLRPIGTNYGDLGALLMKLGHGYDSDEGRAVAARMASLMTGIVYITAAKLAARVGSFPEFEKNREDMLRVMRMHQEADAAIAKRWGQETDEGRKCVLDDGVVSKSAEVWREVLNLGERFGYNVSQATLQAPLGTISFLMGMSTTGIEPAFSLVSHKALVGGGSMKLVNSGIRDALRGLGYAEDAVDSICKYVEEHGCIEGAPGFNPAHLPIFDCAMAQGPSRRFITPMAHIKMMAAIQPLITCAQSKTVNLDVSVTPEEIADIYQESWRLGLKCVALYRDGSKASQPLSAKAATAQKSEERPTAPALLRAPAPRPVVKPAPVSRREKLPPDVTGWRHKFTIDGYKGYIIVNQYPDGRPGEVFLKLGKPGSTISGLVDAFTQMMSIGLQYGIPLPKLISSFTDTRFEPAGMTTNPRIRFAKSIFDYMFKVLDDRYYGGENSGLADRFRKMDDPKDIQEGMTKDGISSAFPTIPAPPAPADPDPGLASSNDALGSRLDPPLKSLDAPPCSRCGAICQRNGSCYLCTSCGTTTGCS